MKLKRCPNLHYYDGDKYEECPHCAAAASAPPPSPPPKPVFEPAPEPQPEPPQQEAVQTAPPPAPRPQEAVQAPPPVPRPQEAVQAPPPVPRPQEVVQTPPPVPRPQEVVQTPPPVSRPQEVVQTPPFVPRPQAAVQTPPPPPQPAVPEQSLTSQIEQVKFTGNIDDARGRATGGSSDPGVTQVIFDELEDDLALGWLVVTNGSAKGKVYTLRSPRMTLGRSDIDRPADIDIRNDRTVSRGPQAEIIYDPLNKIFFLQGLNGKTYVYLNRQLLLTPMELKPYDIVRMGETELVFVPLCSERFSW